MLNYNNLNDVEFEYLCQDIMTAKLNVPFKRYAKGRDGGIDLRYTDANNRIIVQVKHYTESSVSQLITSLKDELEKLKELKPTQYYICCSKQLSPQKTEEIYNLFSDYMESENNIITLLEIDNFLTSEKNTDVLKKHFKLWISSTNILENIFSNDVFLDSESLVAGIEDEENLFVQTSAYNNALNCLKKSRCLLITGDPGVGKTITSKMLILHFAAQGYRVRYTTDGTDLNALKRALSNSPETKEIILLDDCLGQAYFNMKETQGNELLSIIKHVKMHKNKILILNSRVTILKEANERTPELVKSFETKEYRVFLIDMNALPDIEKAKILYNHLFFNGISKQHFKNIKEDKNYLKIIRHPNYNPRVIEYVTNSNRAKDILPQNYFGYILYNLDNPSKIWEEEYVRRLSSVDRILLTTLYSITDTMVSYKFVEDCFNYRIMKNGNIDTSINNFAQSIRHLQQSFIKIVDNPTTGKMISMANPSVNDFIRSYLEENSLEKNDIINSCCSVNQLKRMLNETEFDEKMQLLFLQHKIDKFIFSSRKQKVGYITYYVLTQNIYDDCYIGFIHEYLNSIEMIYVYNKNYVSPLQILKAFSNRKKWDYYNIDEFINNPDNLGGLLDWFELDELVLVLCLLDSYISNEFREMYEIIAKTALENAIEYYCEDVEADDFNIDIESVINQNTGYGEYGPEVDEAAAERQIEDEVVDWVKYDIDKLISKLPLSLQPDKTYIDNLSIYVSGSMGMVDSYLEDWDDDGGYNHPNIENDENEIITIFER